MSTMIVFADGGSRGNPGPSACGYVIYQTELDFGSQTEALAFAKQATPIYAGGDYLGITTNNVAEWQGAIKALEWITVNRAGAHGIFIFLDSQLVVKQITGEYRVKQDHLKPLHKALVQTLVNYKDWKIGHIYRKDNALADREVNIILDSR